MSDTIKLSTVALDCPDPGKLAAFYAEITGGKATYLDAQWATVKGPGGRIDVQPGDHWRFDTDPAGHPFCLTTEDLPDLD